VLRAHTDTADINLSKPGISSILTQLQNHFKTFWHDSLHDDSRGINGSKLRNYRVYKTVFCKEPYLNICDFNKRKHLASLRLSCHKLALETGRHVPASERLNPNQRLCDNCNLSACEDEFHFIMICPKYNVLREDFLLNMQLKFPFIKDYSSELCYMWLMGNMDSSVIINFSNFVYHAFEMRTISNII
jgi:hypothetical protein